ncbi:hypothetical protein HDU83_002168 [Entophlyctis luteolus]|nr:hypothetical protein HDU83_002168 [Entophlyctis luteolus]
MATVFPLPPELVRVILMYMPLDVPTLLRLHRVCRGFHAVLDDPSFVLAHVKEIQSRDGGIPVTEWCNSRQSGGFGLLDCIRDDAIWALPFSHTVAVVWLYLLRPCPSSFQFCFQLDLYIPSITSIRAIDALNIMRRFPYYDPGLALHWAVSRNFQHAVMNLLQSSPATTFNNMHVLLTAIRNSNFEIVKMLVDHPNVYLASSHSSREFVEVGFKVPGVVECLLNCPRFRFSHCEASMLFDLACGAGSVDIATTVLVEYPSVDPSLPDHHALFSTFKGDIDFAKHIFDICRECCPVECMERLVNLFLLGKDFDGDSESHGGVPVCWHAEAIKYLSSEPINYKLEVVFKFALRANAEINVMEFLLENDSTVCEAMFVAACECGRADVVDALLAHNLVDPRFDDNVAIGAACASGAEQVAELLLADARVDCGAAQNRAIQVASEGGHTAVVALLLLNPRCDPRDRDQRAFDLACMNGHVQVVQVLLKDGCTDATYGDMSGLRLAMESGRWEVAQCILAAVFTPLPESVVNCFDTVLQQADEEAYNPECGTGSNFCRTVQVFASDGRILRQLNIKQVECVNAII